MLLRVESRLTEAEEALVSESISCAIAVHRELGPGFRELIYHRALLLELDSRGLSYETEKPVDVRYKEWTIHGQKADLVVGGLVLLEIKTVPKLRALHRHQVTSYLKAAGLKAGLLLNFRSSLLKNGIQRVTLGP